jgi:hypothetical protein
LGGRAERGGRGGEKGREGTGSPFSALSFPGGARGAPHAFGGEQIVRYRIVQAITAAAVLVGVAVAGPGMLPAARGQQTAAGIQVGSVVLAHGVKTANAFGEGDVTPIDPGTNFVETDVPYALVKVTSAPANTPITLRLLDPTGVAYSVNASTPKRRDTKPWQSFQFAAPLYILGTDLEARTGTWHFQVVMNNQVQNDTAFQWQPASAQSMLTIKHALDAAPLQADLHWRYGAALALFNQDPPAVSQLRNAIQLDPKYALYHITLGRLYEREGNKAAAMNEFQTALGIHGSFYDPVFQSWAQEHLNRLKASQ